MEATNSPNLSLPLYKSPQNCQPESLNNSSEPRSYFGRSVLRPGSCNNGEGVNILKETVSDTTFFSTMPPVPPVPCSTRNSSTPRDPKAPAPNNRAEVNENPEFKVPGQGPRSISSLSGAGEGVNMHNTTTALAPTAVAASRVNSNATICSSNSNTTSSTALSWNLSPDLYEGLISWLEKIPFSRPRKHLHRDFADGVLLAEVIAYFFPKMIQLHNYAAAFNIKLKKNNWELLNRKVLPKLGIKLQEIAITEICQAQPGFIEKVLCQIRSLLDKKGEEEKMIKLKELEEAGESGDGALSKTLSEDTCHVHLIPHTQPEFVIYRGVKYIPEEILLRKVKRVEELTKEKVEMMNKVRRLETLIVLKEGHLEDITRQLHESRFKLSQAQPHECVCQWEEGQQPQFCKPRFN